MILDKKPVLPRDDVFITEEISQHFHASPKRKLYGANQGNSTSSSSPSDLEWEHAWDCLTDSGFNTNNTKQLQQQFKRQFLSNRLLRQQRYFRRKNLSESNSSIENLVDNNGCEPRVERYFRCNNAQQQKTHWSKQRTTYNQSKKSNRKTVCQKQFTFKVNLNFKFQGKLELFYQILMDFSEFFCISLKIGILNRGVQKFSGKDPIWATMYITCVGKTMKLALLKHVSFIPSTKRTNTNNDNDS